MPKLFVHSISLAIITLLISGFILGCSIGKRTLPSKGDDKNKVIAKNIDNMIVIENGIVSLGFSKKNGSISYLKDLKRNITYIDGFVKTPFRLEVDGKLDTNFKGFSYSRDQEYGEGKAYELVWDIEDKIRLTSRLELRDASDEVEFTSHLINDSNETILAVEYPVLGGIDKINEGNDYLVHPYVTGILIRDPIKNFSGNGGGLRFMPYPESFSGASMQFMEYYSRDRGGIYCAAYDSEYGQKWLNAYKMSGKLELSHMYGYEDIGPGKDLKAEYPFILKLMDGNGWYEAAETYKEWGTKQPWCSKGPLKEQSPDEKAKWLLEDIGLSTFGINAYHDRTPWIQKYHDTIGTPIFYILGPDWAKTVQDFYSGIPGGLEDWLPTRFSDANLNMIKENEDRFAPFEFDFLVDPNKSDGESLKENMQIFPPDPKSHDAYNFNMLCPYTEFTRNFHVERDLGVYKEAGVDSMYYDISANNLIKTCMSSSHGHPIGGGRAISEGYRTIYKETKEVLSKEAGKYIPLGTEMMNEVFLDVIDYYQARAWAQPSSALETWPLRKLMIFGQAEMIPLFTYVYHEYGAVRLDGWGKLVDEIGELYYHTVAKTYLWGGLYELNHEYSPMEALDGLENDPDEHYYRFKPRGYEFSEERAEYLSKFAHFRTGMANKYLAYGEMQRPLDFENPMVEVDWFHYNHEDQGKGTIEVPSIVTSTWIFDDGKERTLAFFFGNTTDSPMNIDIVINPAEYGLEGTYNIRLISEFEEDSPLIEDMGPMGFKEDMNLAIDLAPREVYMLEVYK